MLMMGGVWRLSRGRIWVGTLLMEPMWRICGGTGGGGWRAMLRFAARSGLRSDLNAWKYPRFCGFANDEPLLTLGLTCGDKTIIS